MKLTRNVVVSAMFVRLYVFARNLPIKAHIKTLMYCTNIFAKKIKDETVKEKLLYDVNVAGMYIIAWMRHKLQGAHTQDTKRGILEAIGETSAFVFGDWMMKILPQYFHEKIENWFGKRGSSGHVHSFMMRSGYNYKKATDFTFIDKCSQNGYTSTCLFENDLKSFMKDFPDIKSLYCRNDNATCYSGAAVLIAKKGVRDKLGIKLESLDFNEAQKGKDQCDRDGAVAERCIQSFVSSGNDVLNAKDVKLALDCSIGSLSNNRSSVVTVSHANGSIGKAKIKDISQYHFFKVEEESNSFRAWKFCNIGTGKLIPLQGVGFDADVATVRAFQKEFPRSKEFMDTEKKKGEENQMFCTDPNCIATFSTEKELDNHLNEQKHDYHIGQDVFVTCW